MPSTQDNVLYVQLRTVFSALLRLLPLASSVKILTISKMVLAWLVLLPVLHVKTTKSVPAARMATSWYQSTDNLQENVKRAVLMLIVSLVEGQQHSVLLVLQASSL